MKQIAVVLALLGMPLGAFAQFQSSVSGFGRIFYEPDSCDLSCAVVTDNPDIQKCKEAHLASMEKVRAVLDGRKEKIISLKQDAAKLETIYANSGTGRDRVFRFTTSYIARVKDVTTLVPLQEGLISAGVTDIMGLDMFSEKLPQLVERARKDAIKDARAKAELAASELGWVLTGASNISFQEADWYGGQKPSSVYGTRELAYSPAKRPELTTYVSSQVSITFTFEKKK